MSTSTVTYALTGDPSLLTSLTLGVVRTDNNAVVVAAGTPYVQDGATTWHATWTDPLPGLTYRVTRTSVYGGRTFVRTRFKSGAGSVTIPSNNDVRFGVGNGAGFGMLVVPHANDVRAGVAFDIASVGAYVPDSSPSSCPDNVPVVPVVSPIVVPSLAVAIRPANADNSAYSFIGNVFVFMTCTTPGTTIRYTIDGSTPSGVRGIVYGSPIRLMQSTVVKAVAIVDRQTRGPVASAIFTKR